MAALLGAWFGGFVGVIFFPLIILTIMKGKRYRSPWRWLAIILAVLFTFAGAYASGILNYGSLLALIVVAWWATTQQRQAQS